MGFNDPKIMICVGYEHYKNENYYTLLKMWQFHNTTIQQRVTRTTRPQLGHEPRSCRSNHSLSNCCAFPVVLILCMFCNSWSQLLPLECTYMLQYDKPRWTVPSGIHLKVMCRLFPTIEYSRSTYSRFKPKHKLVT